MAGERRYRALLVGNGDFPSDPHGLPALHGPAADVALLRRALIEGDGALFAPADVAVLADRKVQRLRESLDEFFASADRNDVLLLYYSGHGRLDLDNRLHLCARDTRTAGLRATALRADDVNEMITSCAARSTIVVLDCCHSGAFKGSDLLSGTDRLAGRAPAMRPGGAGPRAFVDDVTSWWGGLRSGVRRGGRGSSPGRAGFGGPEPDSPGLSGQDSDVAPHRGRYVLASSRSTQLAQDTTDPGQASPFTAALVRGLTEIGPGEALTVPEVYRRVHRLVAGGRGPTPQLRFSGEGELVIARRADSRAVPEPRPDDEDPRHGDARPDPSRVFAREHRRDGWPDDQRPPTAGPDRPPERWRCRRIRDSGVDCLLELRRGLDRHVVEYRAVPRQQGQVFVDGRRIYQGPGLLDCDFRLDRNGTRARLTVSETDIRLVVDGAEVYGLGRAAPGSPDWLEERAAAIRANLLDRFGGIVKEPTLWLRVAPRLRLREVDAVRVRTSRSARAAAQAPIIAVATHRYVGDSGERVWFTDQAMHVRGKDRGLAVPYERLATLAVSSGKAELTLGTEKVSFSGHEPMTRMRKVIEAVQAAVVYQDTGLGEPPPLHRHSGGDALGGGTRQHGTSGPEAPRDPQSGLLAVIIGFAVAQTLLASGTREVELFHYGLGIMVVLAALPCMIAAPLLARTRLFRGFGGAMTLTGVAALLYAVSFNWVPILGNAWARAGGEEELPLYGWLIPLGDAGGIALGGVDTGALGEWPRVWGAVLLAAVAFAVVTTDVILLHRERRRAERGG